MVKLQRLVRKTFDSVRQEPDPKTAARTIARSTRIVGLMLERMGEQRKPLSKPGSILARIGRVLWGLVEIAAPDSLGNILGRHWLSMLYALGLLMVLTGWVVNAGSVIAAGARVLGFTLLVNLAVYSLNRWMKRRSRHVVLLLFALALAAATASGLWIHLGPDTAIGTHGGAAFATAQAGRIVTPGRAVEILGPDPAHPGQPHPASVQALRLALWIDWIFIPAVTLLVLTAGMLFRKFRLFAGIAVGLALSSMLENEQALRTIDAVQFPQAFYLKLAFAAAAIALTGWMLARRLVR
jgi:hypothetical protein